MNLWANRTVKIAEKEDYLDRLYEVYPNEPKERYIEEKAIESIKKSYDKRNCSELLVKLLKLEKFPYKDSYISFLRKDPSAIDRNPQTSKRICETIYGMGFDKLREGVSQPKEANTRRGQQFKEWIRKHFKFVKLEKFKKSKSGIVLLEANEKEARDFCNKELGLGITKRPDLVAKAGRKYVVGEAKFLTATGGNQGRGFDDAVNLASKTTGAAYKIFVLDGILWIERGSQEFKRIEYSNIAALSALLLKDYLKGVSR